MTPKPVDKARDFFGLFVDDVVGAFNTIEKAIDDLCSVWSSLIKFQGELK